MPNRPPKSWWDKKIKEVKQSNPDYSQKQVDETVGHIWYHNMSKSDKEKATRKSEGSCKNYKYLHSQLQIKKAMRKFDANVAFEKLSQLDDDVDRIVELPDYAGESDIFDLAEIAESIYFGQGDPIYALRSRDMSEPRISELQALLVQLEKVASGEYSEDEEWDLSSGVPASMSASEWIPVIKKLISGTHIDETTHYRSSEKQIKGSVNEFDIAKKMQDRGYQYILIASDGREPMYSKSMSGVTELLKNELKDVRVDVKKIADFVK